MLNENNLRPSIELREALTNIDAYHLQFSLNSWYDGYAHSLHSKVIA